MGPPYTAAKINSKAKTHRYNPQYFHLHIKVHTDDYVRVILQHFPLPHMNSLMDGNSKCT